MFESIEKKENELLKNHTTFKIGGPAKYFLLPKNVKELSFAIEQCKLNKLNYFIIGNGSNLLVSDNGFDGAVISLKHFDKIKTRKHKNHIYVTAYSGVNLFTLNKFLAKNGITGLEWSYGIPGSIGGAIKMNAGAYGHETSEFVNKIVVLKNGRIKEIKNPKFSYRNGPINDEIVLYAVFSLSFGEKNNIYNQMKDNLNKRKNTQPYSFPSAGSVFKRNNELYPAKIIDNLGLKGLKIGDAMISTKHAGFIINLGNATFREVVKLINLLKKIFKYYNYNFKEEIIYLN